MTTRRNVNTEKRGYEEERERVDGSSSAPDFSSGVIVKLMSFTFAMITLPIGTYFFSNAYVFNGNATYAGGLAALMANVVLIGYVVMAFMDDQKEQAEEKERERKAL
ncbi:vacuolar ATPase assembly integral membrane protein vma21 [Stagonosporopsis vannaccii]|nr:vacuolar ATPase assembly integral membrane protein vma21 [Stagonosporopsis vannaccii]